MNDPDFLMRPEVEVVYKAIRDSESPLSVYHINEITKKSRPQVYRDITYLIEKGYVEEVPSDRRAKFYRLKDKEVTTDLAPDTSHLFRLWNPILNVYQSPLAFVVWFQTDTRGKDTLKENVRAKNLWHNIRNAIHRALTDWELPEGTVIDHDANYKAYLNYKLSLEMVEMDKAELKARLLDDPEFNEDAAMRLFNNGGLGV